MIQEGRRKEGRKGAGKEGFYKIRKDKS